MIVGGNVEVQRLVYLNSLNDYSFLAHGNLSAQSLVEEGMYTWIGGTVSCKQVLSIQNTIEQGSGDAKKQLVERRATDPKLVFLPEFLDDGYPTMGEIYQAQKDGRQVLA